MSDNDSHSANGCEAIIAGPPYVPGGRTQTRKNKSSAQTNFGWMGLLFPSGKEAAT